MRGEIEETSWSKKEIKQIAIKEISTNFKEKKRTAFYSSNEKKEKIMKRTKKKIYNGNQWSLSH